MLLLLTPAAARAGVLGPADALLRAGPFGSDPYGTTVAGLGDVNGDGLADTAMLQRAPGPDGRPGPSVTVVLGRREPGAAAGGFVIDGAPDQFPDDDVGGARIAQSVGMSVAAAGDVNADGLADVVVGAAALGNSLRRRSGSAFVVFGKSDEAPVRLDALGDGGFRVDGPAGGSALGFTVAGLGDTNGDGRSEVALGSARAAYVVFGKPDGATIDLRAPGGAAYPVAHPSHGRDLEFHPVASAGDANGDGRGDLLVSAPKRRDDGLWVVFGKPDAAPVDLGSLGAGGYEIDGTGLSGIDPYTTDAAGDVNGDGRGDVVIGSGEAAWVVYGRAAPGVTDVRSDDEGVLALTLGEDPDTDFPVAGTGDVNGDGLGDVAIGDPGADGSCRTDAGALTVVYGRAGGGGIDTARLGAGGFRLMSDESQLGLGASFDGAGDVNGDGRADLALDVPLPDTTAAEPENPGPRQRELRIVSAADTGRPRPRRGRCLILRVFARSLRQIRAQRRVRVRVTVKEPRTVLVSPELSKCGPRECWLDPAPEPTDRVLRFRVAGTKTVTVRIGPKTLRALRRPHVTDLTICADEEACVDFPTGHRPRRRG